MLGISVVWPKKATDHVAQLDLFFERLFTNPADATSPIFIGGFSKLGFL